MADGQCSGCALPTKRFASSGSYAKWCSKACRSREREKLPTRRSRLRKRGTWIASGVCEGCGAAFQKVVAYGKNSTSRNGVFCSKDCAWKAFALKRAADAITQREARDALQKRIRDERVVLLSWSARSIRKCLACGEHFTNARGVGPHCSSACARRTSLDIAGRHHAERECKQCGIAFCAVYPHRSRECCSEDCDRARKRRMRRPYKSKEKALRRARERHIQAERIDPIAVFERDGWRCQLCGVPTPRLLRGTYEDCAPELDHRIPLALGGPHTHDNVQCACRACNGRKGATMVMGARVHFPGLCPCGTRAPGFNHLSRIELLGILDDVTSRTAA